MIFKIRDWFNTIEIRLNSLGTDASLDTYINFIDYFFRCKFLCNTSKKLALRANFTRPCRQLMGLWPINSPAGPKLRALRAIPFHIYYTLDTIELRIPMINCVSLKLCSSKEANTVATKYSGCMTTVAKAFLSVFV